LLPRPLLLIALAGSDLQLLLQRRQSLGYNGSGANRGDLLAGCQEFKDRTRLQRSGHVGPVAVASYDDRLCVLSPVDVEVIWRGGGGGGESTPVRIHAMNCFNAPVDRISDQDAALLRRGQKTAVWNYELGNTASFLPSIAVQIASFGGLDKNAGLVFDGDVQSRQAAIDVE
jgi:hypothetical protein